MNQEYQALMAQAILIKDKQNETARKFYEFQTKVESQLKQCDEFRHKFMNLVMKSLRDDDPSVRQWGARLLGEMGPEAKEAAGALKALLDDKDEDVRKTAAAALERAEESRPEDFDWSVP